MVTFLCVDSDWHIIRVLHVNINSSPTAEILFVSEMLELVKICLQIASFLKLTSPKQTQRYQLYSDTEKERQRNLKY